MKTNGDIPLYQIIIDDIQNLIAENKYELDKPLCTEKSLCEKYNVSRITAKRALDMLESDGLLYRKRGVGSFVASAGSKEEPKNFALLLPFSTAQGGIFRTIESTEQVLSKSNSYLSVHIGQKNAGRDREMLEYLYSQNIDGLIYYPWSAEMPLDILRNFAEKSKPVVVLGTPCEDKSLSSIICDNYNGGYMLAEHLISYGHTKTSYLAHEAPDVFYSISERYRGYCQCLKDYNYMPRFSRWESYKQSGGYHFLKHLVNSLYLEGVTAILCVSDEIAYNVYTCCLSLGIRIPEDMNITGFDNIDWSTIASAHITTIDRNAHQIGETIARVLLQKEYSPRHYIIPVKLVPRFSTGKAKAPAALSDSLVRYK